MTTDCPTASVRGLATWSVLGPPPAVPFAFTSMNTGCAGAQGKVVGRVTESAVIVAWFTSTGTPSTSTVLFAAIGAKLLPSSVYVPPGRRGAGSTETISGAPAAGVSVTLMVACTDAESTVAVIIAVPGATPVTSPVEFTPAMSGADDCQTITGLGITFAPVSRAVAIN